MPATAAELKQIVDAFESAHPSLLRALANLQMRGNIVLEQHGLMNTALECKFEDLILTTLWGNGFSSDSFAAVLVDLEKMHLTISELERLP